MSLEHHTLQYGVTTKTLADWGVESCVIETELGISGGRMSLTVSRNIDAADLWPGHAKLTLRDPSGARRFVGVVLTMPRRATADEEARTYEVQGMGCFLQWITYKQLAYFAQDIENPTSELGSQFVSQLVLNRNALTGAALTIKQQMELILEYAVSIKGAPMDYASANLPTVNAPENQVLDQRVSDALAAELAWCPHIAARWDYTGLEPKLEFADVVDGDWGTRILRLAGGPESWEGTPRVDLLTPEVRIDYIGQAQAEGGGATITWRTLNSDVSTVSNGAWGAEEMTVVLRGLVWDGETYTAGEERPPDGLAAAIHKAYAHLYYDMTWSAVSEEVNWLPEVGERWVVDGGGEGFNAANAVCQRITRNIGTGTTSFQCGAPSHLGLGSRLDLLRANRLRNVPVDAGSMTYGMKAPAGEEEGAMETVNIGLFVDGTWVSQPVYVPGPGAPEGPYP